VGQFDGMSDEPKKRSWGWIGWALVAPLVLYPLSAGPAARLCDEINPNPCAVPYHRWRNVYDPLWRIAEKTGTTDTLRRYVDWFRDPRRRYF
jgi:hypothetical protein